MCRNIYLSHVLERCNKYTGVYVTPAYIKRYIHTQMYPYDLGTFLSHNFCESNPSIYVFSLSICTTIGSVYAKKFVFSFACYRSSEILIRHNDDA